MTTTQPTQSKTPRVLAVIGLTLAILVAAYLLPIWLINFYLMTDPYSDGIGWIMVFLVYVGFLIVPLLTLSSIIFATIALIQDRVAKKLPLVTFAILAGSALITYVNFLMLG